MKITTVRAMRLTMPERPATTPPRREPWSVGAEVANPMSRYPKVKAYASAPPSRNSIRNSRSTIVPG